MLQHRVSIYVPSTKDLNVPLPEEEAKAVALRTMRFLAETFGGATMIRGTGGYVSQTDASLITEDVSIVYAFADTLSTERLNEIEAYCSALRDELGQELIALEVDGTMRFI